MPLALLMCGYAGLILEVGLSGSTLNTRSIDQADARLYLGGSGLAARLLSGMNWSGDPFDPDLDLVFATGPITGTPAPCSGRYVVAAKSPLTGGWGEAHASGYWGPELKFAGFDAVVVSDRAERPVYLWIVDGKAELRDASFLWGRDTYETEEILQRELGDPKARVLAIGPAGENRCRIASIMSDHGRAAARGGLGSVMGSKNLKAIAVRGTGRLKLADEKGFADLKSSLIKMIKASPGRQALHTHGTNAAMEAIYAKGDVPIKNWTRGVWDGIGKLTGPAVTQAILKGTSTCRGCPIGCGRMIEVKTGDYAGLKGKGPEYETIAAFGPLSLNDDLGAIAKANDLCNRYGLDTISTGAVIAMAMECRERGLLSEADLGGIDLTWGNGAGIVAMVEKIARRQGLGDLLAEGTLRAARRIGGGAEETAVQTKGFELPMHDPRGFGSWAVAYATAARGGCHVTAPAYWLERGITFPDLGYPEPMDRFNPEGKGRWTAIFQDMCEVMEAMVICKFSVYGGIRSHHLVELIARATGWDVDHREVMQMGERIVNLKKLINLKLGFSNKDDTLPKRLLTISLKEGGSEGHVPDQASMLAEYYRHRGWSEQGVPTAAKLKELGLDGEIGQKLQGAKA